MPVICSSLTICLSKSTAALTPEFIDPLSLNITPETILKAAKRLIAKAPCLPNSSISVLASCRLSPASFEESETFLIESAAFLVSDANLLALILLIDDLRSERALAADEAELDV